MARMVNGDAIFKAMAPHVYLVIPFVILALLFSRAVADIACVLSGLGLIAHSLKTRDWRWAKDPVVVVALVMLGYFVLIVAPFSLDPVKSLVSGLVWIRFVIFYAAVVAIISANPDKIQAIVVLSMGIIVLAAGDALYQYFSGVSVTGHQFRGRLTGPLDRPNIGSFLAKFGFAVFALAFASGFFLPRNDGGKRRRMILGGMAAGLLFVVIVLSRERTATVLMAACLIVVVPGFLLFENRHRKIALSLGGGCIAVLSTLVWLVPALQSRTRKLIKDVSDIGNTPYGDLMDVSFFIAREHTWTGIGFKQFEKICEAMRADGLVKTCTAHPHNPYLDIQVVGGAMGTVLFVTMVGFLVFKFLRAAIDPERRLVASVGLSAVIMTVFPLMSAQSFFSNWPGIVAWLSMAVAVGAIKISPKKIGAGVGPHRIR